MELNIGFERINEMERFEEEDESQGLRE